MTNCNDNFRRLQLWHLLQLVDGGWVLPSDFFWLFYSENTALCAVPKQTIIGNQTIN